MRNSEESSPHNPSPSSRLPSGVIETRPVQPVRAWCDAPHICNGHQKLRDALPFACVEWVFPWESLCEDCVRSRVTLQCNTQRVWLPRFPWIWGAGYHSIPIILVGMVLPFFLSGELVLLFPLRGTDWLAWANLLGLWFSATVDWAGLVDGLGEVEYYCG